MALGAFLDNIVYRREIRMDSLGRLRRGSPVFGAHLTMLAVLAVILAAGLFAGWTGVFWTSGGAIALLAAATYPMAFHRSFDSIRRERLAGTLEQIYLTRLTYRQIFEGKFFGALAPFFEVRRYFLLLSVLLCLSTYKSFGGPHWVLAATFSLIAVNHFAFSAFVGALGGLQAGCRGGPMFAALLRGAAGRVNPGFQHGSIALKNSLILALPVFILVAIGLGGSDAILFIGYALTLLVPLNSAFELRDRERAERDRAAFGFRSILNFEPNAGAAGRA